MVQRQNPLAYWEHQLRPLGYHSVDLFKNGLQVGLEGGQGLLELQCGRGKRRKRCEHGATYREGRILGATCGKLLILLHLQSVLKRKF